MGNLCFRFQALPEQMAHNAYSDIDNHDVDEASLPLFRLGAARPRTAGKVAAA
jgi:hypothetical protein